MKPTRRGLATVAAVVVAVWLAETFGPRSLNAVAGPAVVALAAAVVAVWRADEPTVQRVRTPALFPRERRRVRLDVEGSGLARVADRVDDELGATGATVETTLPATVTYELAPERRGVYELGPTTVTVSDPLGLVERTVERDVRTETLVYPAVFDLAGEGLAALWGETAARERGEFDRLREYVPGDPLRDVHWKSSAKRPDDLVVTEFAAEGRGGEVVVAATAAEGWDDWMATAVASVAVSALAAGHAVGAVVPGGRVGPGRGGPHRTRLLELLARTPAGDVDDRAVADADVVVRADADGVRLAVDDRERDLLAVTRSRANPLLDGEVSANDPDVPGSDVARGAVTARRDGRAADPARRGGESA